LNLFAPIVDFVTEFSKFTSWVNGA